LALALAFELSCKYLAKLGRTVSYSCWSEVLEAGGEHRHHRRLSASVKVTLVLALTETAIVPAAD
jgi:hypothetical protein